MTLHRFINVLLALVIAAMLSTAYLLDGPTDIDAAKAQHLSLQDARKAAQADQHAARASKASGVEL